MATLGRVLVPGRRRARLLAFGAAASRRILALWDEVDVLMTPGLTRTAIQAEGGFGRPFPLAFNLAAAFTPFTPLFNLTGQPAITIPAGVGSDGLPLSVQLVGRRGDALRPGCPARDGAAVGRAAPADLVSWPLNPGPGTRVRRNAQTRWI